MIVRLNAAVIASLIASLIAGWNSPSHAQEIRLFATSLSPANTPFSVFFKEWGQKVDKDSNGTLKIEVKDGFALANHQNMYSRVLDDVVQVGWAVHVWVAGKFPLTAVTGLPFLSENSEIGSTALWRVYKAGVLDNEYSEVTPLWLTGFPQSTFHFAKAPHTTDDLKGLKLSIQVPIQAQIASRLGATPLSVSPGDQYEALQRGTIDGTVTGWATLVPYKLAEVTRYHLDVPFGTSTSMVFMTKKKFDALPAQARTALMKNSEEAQSRAFGKELDGQGNAERARVQKLPGEQVVDQSAQQAAAWRAQAQPLIDNWVTNQPGADKVIESYRHFYRQVKAGN